MENRNPYASPGSKVSDDVGSDGQEYGEIRIFSAQGRLGRVRYIGYTTGLAILIAIIGFGLTGILAATGQSTIAVVIGGATYVALIVMQVLLTIQRAHDFDTSGWLSVVLFVPLAALIFWFIPGTKGGNRFGNPPPPNTGGAILLALIPLPLIFIVGILAAIAIPAYQDYTVRAQVSEGLNLAAGVKAAVVETYRRTDTAPADRIDAGLSADAADGGGRYADSIDVVDGTILVTYGPQASAQIASRVLALQPYVTADGNVLWQCGHASAPAGAVAMDPDGVPANAATTVEPRHLPSACRP